MLILPNSQIIIFFISSATSTLTQWTGCGGKTEIQILQHLVSAPAWILTGTSATNGDMRCDWALIGQDRSRDLNTGL